MRRWVMRRPDHSVHALGRPAGLDVMGQTDSFNPFLDSFSTWNFLQINTHRRRYQGIERALRRFLLLRSDIISNFVSCDWHFRHRSRIYQMRLQGAWCFLRFSTNGLARHMENGGGEEVTMAFYFFLLTTCILPDPGRAFWCIRRRREELRHGNGRSKGSQWVAKADVLLVFLEVPSRFLPFLLHIQYMIESSALSTTGGSEWKMEDDAIGLHLDTNVT